MTSHIRASTRERTSAPAGAFERARAPLVWLAYPTSALPVGRVRGLYRPGTPAWTHEGCSSPAFPVQRAWCSTGPIGEPRRAGPYGLGCILSDVRALDLPGRRASTRRAPPCPTAPLQRVRPHGSGSTCPTHTT